MHRVGGCDCRWNALGAESLKVPARFQRILGSVGR